MGDGGSRRSPFVVYWVPVLVYLCLILAVSSLSGRTLEPLRLASWDKAAHAVEYAVLSLLVARALAHDGPWERAPSPRAIAAIAFAAAVAWGAIDESYQRLTGRQPDVFDWLADSAGALAAQAAALRVRGTPIPNKNAEKDALNGKRSA
jgi:VanZ family protein